MKFAWTVAGDDPDYGKGDEHGINGYYWPGFDALTTKVNLNDTVARGYVVGLYVVTSWPQFSGRTNVDIAKLIVAEYKRLATGTNAVPGLRLQVDDERKNPNAILTVLQGIRAALPKTNLSWTMEAGQAGWMNDPDFMKAILALKLRIVPQCYNGAMTQVWDTWAYCKALLDGGWPASIISPFYDAAHLPVGWDGFAFTVGRLPA